MHLVEFTFTCFFASFQNGWDPLLLLPSSNTFFDGQDGETPNGQAVNSMGPTVVEISFFSSGHSFGVFFLPERLISIR